MGLFTRCKLNVNGTFLKSKINISINRLYKLVKSMLVEVGDRCVIPQVNITQKGIHKNM